MSRKSWLSQEIDYLRENYSTIDTSTISQKLNRSNTSIIHKAIRLGLSKIDRYEMWSTDDIICLKNNYSDKNLHDLSILLKRSELSIIKKARQLKLYKSKDYLKKMAKDIGKIVSLKKSKPIDHDYFEKIDSKEKAYWLGWIWSDGSILTDKYSKIISLRIHTKDISILEMLKRDLKSSHKISSTICNNRLSSGLKFTSSKMFNDLLKYNITPNKTYDNKEPINIPEEYLSHFVRGVFDGDGCITSWEKKYMQRACIKIACTKTFCFWLKNLLNKTLDVGGCNHHRNEWYVCWEYCLNGRKQVKKLAEWLYKDAGNHYLKRKYDKFKELELF